MNRPTLQTVAQWCGVSTSTVSRALSRPDVVRPEVRERVLAAATEIGYTPNKLARGLATGRLGRVGLLLPDVANPFFTELLRVIQHAVLTTSGASLLIMNSDERATDEAELVTSLLTEVDGVILAAPRAPTADLRDAMGSAPAVLINRSIPGHDTVLIQYQDAIMQAGEHLRATGHRRVALVRGPSASWAAQQRARAVMRWAKLSGVELVDLGAGAPTFEAGLQSATALIDSRATAVIAYDDMVASGIIAGMHAAGLSVPRDMAVVGCDDTLLARLLTPSMTTIRPPYSEIGRIATALLNDRIAHAGRPARTRKPACVLSLRESSQMSDFPEPQQGPVHNRPDAAPGEPRSLTSR